METQLSTFGIMLQSFDQKVKQVSQMRKSLDQELSQVQHFFDSKEKLTDQIFELKEAVEEISELNLRQMVKQELTKYKVYQTELLKMIMRYYENYISDLKKGYEKEMREKENEIQNSSMISKGFKGKEKEGFRTKFKNDEDDKCLKNKNVKSKVNLEKQKFVHKGRQKRQPIRFITKHKQEPKQNRKEANIEQIRSVFKMHRLSLDMYSKPSKELLLSPNPYTFVKTTFPSPEKKDLSLDKEEDYLIVSSNSLLKKHNDSLFEQLDVKSKRKEFNESTPFEAEVSRVEQSLENQNNMFAKLTFGKNQTKYLRELPKGEDSEIKQRKNLLKKHVKNNKTVGITKEEEEVSFINQNIQRLKEMQARRDRKKQEEKEKEKERQKQILREQERQKQIEINILKDINKFNITEEFESKRSSLSSLSAHKNYSHKNLGSVGKLPSQQKYLQCIKKSFNKENSSFCLTSPLLYLGTADKQMKYEGFERDNLKFGNGALHYSDGFVYNGMFEKGHRQGFGILTLDGLQIYSGDWTLDQLHGQGRLRNHPILKFNSNALKVKNQPTPFSNWISYMGTFIENVFNGHGQLELPKGEKFVGEFVNGRVEGEGTYYKSNGEMKFGTWKGNVLVEEI